VTPPAGEQPSLVEGTGRKDAGAEALPAELAAFSCAGRPTITSTTTVTEPGGGPVAVPTFTNEFWTSRQRAAHSLHEVSYRACFKPQLPRFFTERLTRPGQRVYDPFMGRGTTLIEAALLDRRVAGCDVNPLSRVLVQPRLAPPDLPEIEARLASLDLAGAPAHHGDLLAFYHPETLSALAGLRAYLLARQAAGSLDDVDRWIRMVAVNRLTGHSPGFFSVYTMPPNQAVSAATQQKLNARRGQVPPLRDVKRIILKKSASLLADCDGVTRARLHARGADAALVTARASSTPDIPDRSVDLVVTSPPFLDVVNYAGDNWLRCWFAGIDPAAVAITMARRLDDWRAAMAEVFVELARVVRPGGHVAFEVGEVKAGRVRLEETVVPAAMEAGLEPVLILINAQAFTKTANCWGVTNNARGTNTNRVVLLRRP
jgi:hypothetical protein